MQYLNNVCDRASQTFLLAAHSKGLSPTMIHHQIKTRDDVTIHVMETGNLSRSAVLFVHGISQSWRSWLAQFADPRLPERFRLVALDLRGHGESQGAFGAVRRRRPGG